MPIPEISSHALDRMRQRGVSLEEVRSVVKGSVPFRYFHEDTWKTGYYDARNGIFICQAGNTITTVMTDVAPGYIEALKQRSP